MIHPTVPVIGLVTVACDGGEKYLNTIFNDSWLEREISWPLRSFEYAVGLLSGHQDNTNPRARVTWRRGDPIPDSALLSPHAYNTAPHNTACIDDAFKRNEDFL